MKSLFTLKDKFKPCCCFCADRTTEYITEIKLKGTLIRAACGDICQNSS